MEVLNGKGDGNKNGDYTGLENGRVEGGAKAQNGSGLDEDKEGGARRPHRDKGLVEEERVGGDEDNTDEGSELDAVLRWADRRGAYERLLVWAWVAPVCLLAPCMYMNILLMVYLPSHTCSLPPPPDSLSLDAWRNITTPRDDSGRLSSCTVYDFPAALDDLSSHPQNDHLRESLDVLSSHPQNDHLRESLDDLSSHPQNDHLRESLDHNHDLDNNHNHSLENNHNHDLDNNHNHDHDNNHNHSLENNHNHDFDNNHNHSLENNHNHSLDNNHNHSLDNNHNHSLDNNHNHSLDNNHNHDLDNNHNHSLENNHNHSLDNNHNHSLDNNHNHFLDNNHNHSYENSPHSPHDSHSPLEAQEGYLRAAMTWQERHPDSSPTQFTTECVFGYDFDRTYFEETEATEMGWACGEVGAIQQVLHAAMLGNLFGCVIYGALADKVGRRLVFLLLALKVAVLGSTYVFLKEMWVVLMVRFLVSMGLPVLYQIVIISALEQVRDEHRGMVTSLSSICFSVGQCLLALVTWLTGHWVKLGLVTSVPALLALVYIKVIEESPRWLVARGRLEEAAKVLLRVAKMNRLAPTHRDVLARLHKACGHPLDSPPRTQRSGRESNACLGILGLLTLYPRLCYRTALVTVCWTVNLILYFSSTMKYPYVFENPFLGWFCTSAMEIPANLLVLVLLRKIGRRPLHAGVMSLCAAALLCAAVVLAFGYGERHRGVAALVLVAKFCTSMTFLVIYLQAAELHPTPVRTCATGFASLIALTCNIFSPSILTMTHPWQSYLLMGCLGCAGVLSAALLPETKDRPLPQTLEEAENLTRRPKVSKDEGRRGSLEVDLVSKSSLNDPASSVLKATDVETNI